MDLKEGLREAVGESNLRKILQVSMGGPAVNFCIMDQFRTELRDEYPTKSTILELGSCGPHNVHGAFKAWIKKLNWEIDAFLRSLHFLFHKAPARRGYYTQIALSDVLPLDFCSIRWLEKIATRANSMLPFLKIWVDSIEKEGKRTPSIRIILTFEFLQTLYRLSGAKLAFFISLSSLVEPFLIDFQSDAPLTPFLYEDLQF